MTHQTTTTVLAAAMDALARDIVSEDGVAKAAIAEAAQRLRALHAENEALRSMAHRLALDLECLLLSTDNPAATKWWNEAQATLAAWRGWANKEPS